MAHVAKYTAGQTAPLTRHYERHALPDGDHMRYRNQDIDTTRSHLNHNLAPEREGGQLAHISRRLSEAHFYGRRNMITMCCWVLTLPDGIPRERTREFFESSYRFMANRYGEENAVSAYVHMDETTPHMHFAFVPVGWDAKNSRHTVSARTVLTRAELSSFHGDLDRHLRREMGIERSGVLNGATAGGNRTVAELESDRASSRLDILLEEVAVLERRRDALVGMVRALAEPTSVRVTGEDAAEASEVPAPMSTAQVEATRPRRTILGGLVIDRRELEALRRTAAEAARLSERAAQYRLEARSAKTEAASLARSLALARSGMAEMHREIRELRKILAAAERMEPGRLARAKEEAEKGKARKKDRRKRDKSR